MDHENLIAIDTHTHAEVGCWNPFDNYGQEYDRAADKYFRSSRRPTIAETIAYYRERRIGLVMFTVDAETQMGRRRIPNEEIAEAAHQALSQVGIPEKLWARTDELSGGQQQRVAIARVLLQNPEVILADEPVSSVDPTLAHGIVRLLVELCGTFRKTLVMNLHSVDLALAFFPRVIGFRDGQVAFDRSPAEISDDLLADLYAGRMAGVTVQDS